MATTVYDIARVAGVSRTTVLRALWDREKINPETKRRVLQVAAELNYKPNHIARSLTLGSTGFIGVLASHIDGPVFGLYIEPIDYHLRESGYSMLFYTSRGDAKGDKLCIDEMVSKRIIGALIVPSSVTTDPHIYKDLIDSGIHTVIIDREVEGLDVPQISADHYKAGRVATQYLISLGHQRIANLTIPQNSPTGRHRVRGYMDAMANAGIQVDPSLILETSMSIESGYEVMSRLLKLSKPPTAVVARYDGTAVGAMNAVFAAGLSVPNDVSVIGYGNMKLSDNLRVPLTTFEPPTQSMAEVAIQTLLDSIAGKEHDTDNELLDVELIIRDSCAPPLKSKLQSKTRASIAARL